MSADSFHLFYGVQIPIDLEDLEAIGMATDPRVVHAAQHGLQTSSAVTGRPRDIPSVSLLVGRRVAALGHEHDPEHVLPRDELLELMRSTEGLLQQAGYAEAPSMIAHFHMDGWQAIWG